MTNQKLKMVQCPSCGAKFEFSFDNICPTNFINLPKENSEVKNYPHFIANILSKISSTRSRLFCSFIFLLFFTFERYFAFEKTKYYGSGSLISNIQNDFFWFLRGWTIVYLAIYIVLTIIYFSLRKIFQNWATSRSVRLWFFWSLVWNALVMLYLVVFRPYGRFFPIYTDSILSLIALMLGPPLLIGIAKHIYAKYI